MKTHWARMATALIVMGMSFLLPQGAAAQVASGPSFCPAAGPEWRFRFAAYFLFPR